jgi:MFS superfamily sulfate permease-like transporter
VSINRDNKFIGKFNANELKNLEDHGDVLVYRFAGELTYINCQGHVEMINTISPKTEAVVLGFRNLYYVDIDGLDIVTEIIETLEDQNKKIALSGINGVVRPLFEKMPWFKKFQDSHLLFPNSQAAVEYLQK